MADRIDAVMQTDFLVLRPDMPIRKAVAALLAHPAAAAPVVGEDGALAGILTQRDCFRSAMAASYYQQWTGSVADHMSTEVVTLDASTDVMAAAEAFLEKPFRAYPVTRERTLVGMLHRSDVLGAFLAFG